MQTIKFELRDRAGWKYWAFPGLEEEGIRHGFFTRLGPSYRLEGEERARFLDTFGLTDLAVMAQEHSDKVHIIENGERPQSGDGLILLERGVAGIIKTADCLPVILAEPGFPMAAIIHAGWRGTVQRITSKAVEKMTALGAKREKIVALLGPSIGPCCYEVQHDVEEAFMKAGFSSSVIRREGGRLTLDIREANREALAASGVEEVHDADLCTYCTDGLFHSFRKGEAVMRQINFVSLAR